MGGAYLWEGLIYGRRGLIRIEFVYIRPMQGCPMSTWCRVQDNRGQGCVHMPISAVWEVQNRTGMWI